MRKLFSGRGIPPSPEQPIPPLHHPGHPTPSHSDDSAGIVEVQQVLKDLGLYRLDITGKWDEGSRSALDELKSNYREAMARIRTLETQAARQVPDVPPDLVADAEAYRRLIEVLRPGLLRTVK